MTVIVIGLGSMGKRRIRLLKQIVDSIQIIGLDSDKERAKDVADSFGITCIQSIEEAEGYKDIQCAFICTSPISHGDVINTCLKKGWHIFTEINLISDRYKENMELADQKSKVLFLSSTQLYRKEMQIIKEKLQKSTANYIYHVGQYLPDWHPWESYEQYFVSDKRTNGCKELLAIELPWILATFGPVKNVSVKANKLTKLRLDYPDFYNIQIIHENDSIGSIVIDVVSREPVRKLEIINEENYLQWEGKPSTLRQKNLETGIMEEICDEECIRQEGYQEFINEYAYIKEIKEFFEVIKGKIAEYGFSQDFETLKLIEEIEKMAGET